MEQIPPELLVSILKHLPGDDLSAMKNVNHTLKQFMHKHRKSLPPQKPWVDIKVLKERVFDRVPRQVFTIITRKGEFNVYFGCYGIVYNRDKPLTWRFFREYDKQVAKLPFRLHFTTFFEYLFSRVNIDQLIFEIPLFTEVEKPFNDVLTSSGCIVKNVVVNPYTWVLWDELYECYLLVIGELKKRPKLRINSDDTWFKRFTHGSKNKIHYLNRLGERFSETVVHFSWEHFYYVMFTLAEIRV